MAFLNIKKISKFYISDQEADGRVVVFDNFTLSVALGEFVCFFGPNACGKTTILKMISGLIPLDEGTVTVDGRSPGQVKMSYVFQNLEGTLFPWRTCLDNIAFPLEAYGLTKREAREEVLCFVEGIDNTFPLHRYPHELSGGQKQLIAVYRALVSNPELLLLDEPFSELDFDRRTRMEQILLRILADRPTTTIFVSHEIEEAVFLSDRVIILGGHPTTICAEVPVNLDKPRKLSMLESAQFSRIRDTVLHAFRCGKANDL